jgi:hypothetical protein
MKSAPCGRICSKCPLFGASCEGCQTEMSFSFAYHCREYTKVASEKPSGRNVPSCGVVEGTTAICPLVAQKSLKSSIKLTASQESPIN